MISSVCEVEERGSRVGETVRPGLLGYTQGVADMHTEASGTQPPRNPVASRTPPCQDPGGRSRAVFWAASRAARRPSGGMPKRKAPEGDPRDDEPDDELDDNEDEEQRRQREDKEDEEMQDRLAKRSSQDRMG